MSVDAFVDFGIRLAGETAIDVIQLVGSDDTRAAAATRALVFFGTATVCALGIWFLLPMMVSGQASIFAVACFVVIIGIGGYVTRRAFGEVWRLVHRGEPGVIADKAELTISKHKKTIAWNEITAVTPERRGGLGRVRIVLAKTSTPHIFIATRRSAALAEAILAGAALKRLAKA